VIGHRAIVHGTIIEEGCLIGMGAILLNRCHIGAGSIIGAGAVLTEGTVVPPGSLVVGIPAKVVRQLDAAQQSRILDNAQRYVDLKERHRNGEFAQHESDMQRDDRGVEL
jgi:carbonic anhydrase/acetyltransferase-like protein (isoleucine patch superfamily)